MLNLCMYRRWDVVLSFFGIMCICIINILEFESFFILGGLTWGTETEGN